MEDMTQTLEMMLLCESLSNAEHDCVERALEEGYEYLADKDRALIRRLLNRRAAKTSLTPLQRYRLRRQAEMRGTPRMTPARASQRAAAH